MERALHDPEKGYYSRKISGIGRKGDFTTAPTLSSLLGRAIADWARRALKETGTKDLIEIGPGEGILAKTVLEHLPWLTRLGVRLHLVESSSPLTEIQQALLGKRATWHKTPAAALDACRGKAVIYSNELVDAFPVRRFQNTPQGWQEIALRPGRPPEEVLLPLSPLPDSSSFLLDHPLHQRIEVHESYQSWMAGWMPQWKAGRMLTIDYGAEDQQLYQRRLHGTLRAYLLQQRLEGLAIYENAGRQDLTADVNFTDLIHWSREWCETTRLMTLADFTKPHVDHGNPADLQLVDEHGAGSAFLVLEQSRLP